MSISFVNVHGTPIDIGSCPSHHKPIRPKPEAKQYHKGWRVVGHPPGAFESALEGNQRVQKMAEVSGGKPIETLTHDEWLRTTKKKPVRSKPYGLVGAADQCADLARKAGWSHVEVVEIKRGEAQGVL